MSVETEGLFKNKYRIKSARLNGYDYSLPGYYFVTICTLNREHYFGEIKNGKIQYQRIGRITRIYWLEIPKHFPNVRLDEFIVMPNHVHGIIIITNQLETQNIVETQNFVSLRECYPLWHHNKFSPQSKNLSSIIRGYKIGVKKYATIHSIEFFWQTRFYDRIIRDEDELDRIRQYIIDNTDKWENDKNNPENLIF